MIYCGRCMYTYTAVYTRTSRPVKKYWAIPLAVAHRPCNIKQRAQSINNSYGMLHTPEYFEVQNMLQPPSRPERGRMSSVLPRQLPAMACRWLKWLGLNQSLWRMALLIAAALLEAQLGDGVQPVMSQSRPVEYSARRAP